MGRNAREEWNRTPSSSAGFNSPPLIPGSGYHINDGLPVEFTLLFVDNDNRILPVSLGKSSRRQVTGISGHTGGREGGAVSNPGHTVAYDTSPVLQSMATSICACG